MRKAFELFATGAYSKDMLVQRLAQDGLRSRSGRPIPGSHIQRLLTNPFYIGRLIWQDLEVAGGHPRLISDELFQRVQATIRQRARDHGSKSTHGDFPLRGVAICAGCRGHMTGEWHGQWAYYRCSRRSYRRSACDARLCNVKNAHANLTNILKGVSISKTTAAAIMKAVDKLLSEQARTQSSLRASTDSTPRSLMADGAALTEAFAAGDLTPKEYQKRISQLQATISQSHGQPSQGAGISSEPGSVRARVQKMLSVATSVGDLYRSVRGDHAADLLRLMFDTVVLNDAGIVGFSLKTPFRLLTEARDHIGRDGSGVAEGILRAAGDELATVA